MQVNTQCPSSGCSSLSGVQQCKEVNATLTGPKGQKGIPSERMTIKSPNLIRTTALVQLLNPGHVLGIDTTSSQHHSSLKTALEGPRYAEEVGTVTVPGLSCHPLPCIPP